MTLLSKNLDYSACQLQAEHAHVRVKMGNYTKSKRCCESLLPWCVVVSSLCWPSKSTDSLAEAETILLRDPSLSLSLSLSLFPGIYVHTYTRIHTQRAERIPCDLRRILEFRGNSLSKCNTHSQCYSEILPSALPNLTLRLEECCTCHQNPAYAC